MKFQGYLDYEGKDDRVKAIFALTILLGKFDVLGVHRTHMYMDRFGVVESMAISYDIK